MPLVKPRPIPSVYPRKIRSGCVLYLDFQDIGSKIIDHSGFNNHGVNYGSTAVTGPFGYVRHFDGVDDYINCGNAASLDLTGNMTIEVMQYRTGVSQYCALLAKGADSVDAYIPYQVRYNKTNTLLLFFIGDGASTNSVSITAPSINAWHHTVAVLETNLLKLYVDGVLGGAPVTRTINPYVSRERDVRIGRGGYLFKGFVGIIRIYNRALFPAEIAEIYAEEAWRFGLAA